ncbi:MAG: T9SS type A sorting domain-containing protein [Bacteroidales bacterium]|nr:T9SS type A sorting domain-containing protein [Bacteroidales bacterium]
MTDSIIINVNKAALIVRAKDTTVILEDKEPLYQLEFEGFVNNDDTTEIDTMPGAYVANFSELGIGEHNDAIVVTGGADNNYEFIYQNGILTIEQSVSVIADSYRDISLYPNPVKDILAMINLPAGTRYALFDMSGKTVLQGKTDDCNAYLDLSGLKNGFYILSIALTELTKEVKIIKQ